MPRTRALIFFLLLTACVAVQNFIDPFGLKQVAAEQPKEKSAKSAIYAVTAYDAERAAVISLTDKKVAGFWVGPQGQPNKGAGLYYTREQGTCFVLYDYTDKNQLGAQFAVTIDADTGQPVMQIAKGKSVRFVPLNELADMFDEWKASKKK